MLGATVYVLHGVIISATVLHKHIENCGSSQFIQPGQCDPASTRTIIVESAADGGSG